jgi:hypothetical protein
MDKEQIHKQSFELIKKSFEIESRDDVDSRDAMIKAIAERVSYWLEYDLEQLFSFLYRMDIDQFKVEKALELGNIIPANLGIAELIFERQVARVETKLKYKQDEIEGLDDELRY